MLDAKLDPQIIGLKVFQTVPTCTREPDSWGRSLLSEMEASNTQHGVHVYLILQSCSAA